MVFRNIRKSRSQKPERQFLSYSDINFCLLIWGIGRDEDLEQLIELENMLKADGKQVISCCYINAKETSLRAATNRIVFTKKDLSIFGKPSDTVLNQLKNKPFDVVFDVGRQSSVPLLYILANANSTLFCGTDGNPDFDFNFRIETANYPETGRKFVLEQFIFYLKKIQPRS